jgi:predicted small secreted protein
MISCRRIGRAALRGAVSMVALAALALSACSTTMPGGAGPRADVGSGSSSPPGTLSRELDRSGGVIEPPRGVDPGMTQPPPNQGAQRTPVIPPPGTPGGDPMVKPR